eukprot:4932413-Pyramimonas_sp.AAC.1
MRVGCTSLRFECRLDAGTVCKLVSPIQHVACSCGCRPTWPLILHIPPLMSLAAVAAHHGVCRHSWSFAPSARSSVTCLNLFGDWCVIVFAVRLVARQKSHQPSVRIWFKDRPTPTSFSPFGERPPIPWTWTGGGGRERSGRPRWPSIAPRGAQRAQDGLHDGSR